MAVSHKDHDHPNTPAARAACRKAMAATPGKSFAENAGVPTAMQKLASGIVKPAQMTVVPRKRGDGGVVKGLQATAPRIADRRLKVSGTMIKVTGDLADMPVELAAAVRAAWEKDWDVQVGERFNETERRVVISGEVGIVSLVWSDSLDKVRTAVFVRSYDSSVTRRVPAGWERAMHLVSDSANWKWKDADNRCI